jgi:hydrogenase nickel incorporation protein HypB
MCQECGCGNKKEEHEHKREIVIEKNIKEHNDKVAHDNWHYLDEKKIFCINIMGSPGSGKTTFIEGISRFINPKDIFVIQGDLESDIDKKRLEKAGISAYQINTHSGCHLNADMIKTAMMNIDITGKKYLLIENVGNLVCPAGVSLGQMLNIVVSSVAEGSDKPKKYPYIFMDANMIILSKYDIAGAVDFQEEEYLKDIMNINSKAKIFKTSKNKDSFHEPAHFLEHERQHSFEEEHHHH